MPGSELPGPDVLPHGPLRTLTTELHGLYKKAGMPSARLVQTWVRKDPQCTESVSHTTFRTMLRGTALVSWTKWRSVVHVLAAHAVNLADPEVQIARFQALWLPAASPEASLTSTMPVRATAPARSIAHTHVPAQELPHQQFARQLCMPVYLAVDAPSPAGMRDVQFDRVLDELHDQLTSAPRIAELAHVSVLAFCQDPYVVVELTAVDDLIRMPKVTCAGAPDYAAAFSMLRHQIAADVSALGDQGWGVRRPLVLLLSNGGPENGSWQEAYGRLVAPGYRSRPHIIGYGFSQAAYAFVAQVATLAAFQADLNDTGAVRDGLLPTVEAMLMSMVASGVSRSLSRPEEPAAGFVALDVEYLD